MTKIKKQKLNRQKAEKPDRNPKGLVEVIEVFPTIQGEGPYAGLPAIFIRLAGCTLQCPACDTQYTVGRVRKNPSQIVTQCQSLMKGCLVVITGGEPFRQNITYLTRLLLNAGYQVQIETNGTLYLDGFPYKKVTVVCSPKTSIIDSYYSQSADYFKYIIDEGKVDPEDGLPTQSLGMKQRPARPGNEEIPIYVQPADASPDEEQSTKNLEATVQSTMMFGHRLCIQLHKLIGMP